MTQRDRPPELERLDAGAGPARALSVAEAEAQAQHVLSGLRRKPKPSRRAWLVAAACLVALGVLASRAALERATQVSDQRARQAVSTRAPVTTNVEAPSAAEVPNAQQDTAAPPTPTAPRDWLKLANAAREQRDYARARQLYARAVEASPESDEAYAANVAAADLEREHLGDASAALTRYATVLRARPNGPLAEQAQLGMARAYGVLGDRARESAAWRALLRSHPSSWFAGEAQARLRALNAETSGPDAG